MAVKPVDYAERLRKCLARSDQLVAKANSDDDKVKLALARYKICQTDFATATQAHSTAGSNLHKVNQEVGGHTLKHAAVAGITFVGGLFVGLILGKG
jgi:hypothetical protein